MEASDYDGPVHPCPGTLAVPADAQHRGISSWDRVADWYDGWVGDRGSRYHRALAIPAVLDLLDARTDERILDIGAGQGVLAPFVAERRAHYTGVDASPRLIAAARRRHGQYARFVVGDARALDRVPGLHAGSHDAAVFLLSIQDMDPLEPVLASAAWALRPSSRIVVLMTHPAFRQPRHSGWGYDENRKLQFRRVDAYLTPMTVPMKSLGRTAPTRAFHRPIRSYVNALGAVGFAVDAMLELPDLPPDARPRRSRRASTRADAEIPLFLGLRAIRSHSGGSAQSSGKSAQAHSSLIPVAAAGYDPDVENTARDSKLELLRRVPLFAGLEAESLEAIAAITEERDVEAGATLTTEGRHEGYFFVIVTGRIRVERGGRVINTLTDGDFLGEIALLDGGPRTATAIAESPCRLLVMTHQRFSQLLASAPEVRTAVFEEVGRRLRTLDTESAH